jgi:WD40 repeat protein
MFPPTASALHLERRRHRSSAGRGDRRECVDPFADAGRDTLFRSERRLRQILTVAGPATFAVGYWNGATPMTHDAASGAVLATIRDPSAARAELSPDGTKIVTAGFDTSARIRDAATGKVLFELAGHEQRVTSAHFSADGSKAVTCSYDGTARVWDASTGRSLAVLRGKDDFVCAGAYFGGDPEQVFTLGGATYEAYDRLELWNWVRTPGGSGRELRRPRRDDPDLASSSDGRLLVTGGKDQTARIWDTASGRCLQVLSGYQDFVNGVAVSPNGKWVVTASGDGTANVWDSATGEKLLALGPDEHPRTSAAFSPDGLRIATGTTSGDTYLYSCPVLGSVDDLRALARTRVKRELTPEERKKHLGR